MNMPNEPAQVARADTQETQPAPGTANDPIRRIFFAPDGLRPGWRLAIFIGLVMALRSAVSFALHAAHFHLSVSDFTARANIIRDGLAFLVVLAASTIMAGFEKRSLGDYGLPLPGAFSKVCCGDLSPSAPPSSPSTLRATSAFRDSISRAARLCITPGCGPSRSS